MKKVINVSLSVLLSLILCQCNHKNTGNVPTQKELDEETNAKLRAESKKAWAEARSIVFTDSDFLKTKEPMSDNAIAPYDYHTGLVGNKAYNQIVYLKAIERAKKKLTVKDNQLVLTIKSGAEINIAEDLFEYIVDLFKDWNKWIKEGRFKIVPMKEGYDIR